jgi:VanZ family protein
MNLINLLKAHKDKVYHFFCCYTAMLTLTAIAIIKWESPVAWSVNFGIACAVLVGVAKEFFDLYVKKSKFSVGDIIADVLGIAIAFLIVGV